MGIRSSRDAIGTPEIGRTVRILAIETSTSDYEVGVSSDSAHVVCTGNRFQDDYDGIAGLVERCLAEAETDVSSIDAIVVDRGPGNLTSVRSGLAYANALAYATKLPLYAVSSLEAMAYAAQSADASGTPVFVALAARNKESGPFLAALHEKGIASRFAFDYLEKLASTLVSGYPRLNLAGSHIDAQVKSLPRIETLDSGITRPQVRTLPTLLRDGILEAAQQALPLTEDSDEFRG